MQTLIEFTRHANRLAHHAYRGTWDDKSEGESLTALIDDAWAEAEARGMADLAKKMESAFNHLTGR